MSDRIFQDREKAREADYFRKEEARLLEKLRQHAKLEDIAGALRDKLQVDNPELLAAVRDLGITAETVAAFFLAPLVHGGSLVLVRNPDERAWPARRHDERATVGLRAADQPPSE